MVCIQSNRPNKLDITFSITEDGKVTVDLELPPHDKVGLYAEHLGNMLFALTNSYMNEVITDSLIEQLGNCIFLDDVLRQWAESTNKIFEASPIVKPAEVL